MTGHLLNLYLLKPTLPMMQRLLNIPLQYLLPGGILLNKLRRIFRAINRQTQRNLIIILNQLPINIRQLQRYPTINKNNIREVPFSIKRQL